MQTSLMWRFGIIVSRCNMRRGNYGNYTSQFYVRHHLPGWHLSLSDISQRNELSCLSISMPLSMRTSQMVLIRKMWQRQKVRKIYRKRDESDDKDESYDMNSWNAEFLDRELVYEARDSRKMCWLRGQKGSLYC